MKPANNLRGQQTQGNSTASRGLTTVALLKVNFDAGKDYLDMFMPFVRDAIATLEKDDFDIGHIRSRIQQRHGLSIPLDTLQTLLRRTTKHKLLRREGGRYFRNDETALEYDISSDRKAVQREIYALSSALMAFANTDGIRLATVDDATALIFEFLSEYRTQLLLDDEELDQLEFKIDNLNMRLVAGFVNDVCLRDPHLSSYLNNVVVGFVLQSALLLKDVASFSGSFNNLQVYFDSGLLFSALGYTGEAAKLAGREAIELLKNTGALVRVFDVTVREMQVILGVYEEHLKTPDGKATLHPTDLTRYFLTNRYTPSDVRQEIALLQNNLKRLGVEIIQSPNRVAEYTENELQLAEMLKRPNERRDHPRVTHDVDCIAAVLTLRRGNASKTLDTTPAVFATGSRHVINTVNLWYTETGRGGISPIIHQLTLSSAAWLKRPASAANLKLHELVALCAAALRPSRETWGKFLQHLKELENSGEISSDEALAVVVSSFTDEVLADVESVDHDPDSDTLTQVVERVKAAYRADADEEIIRIRREAGQEIARVNAVATTTMADRALLEARTAKLLAALERKAEGVARFVSGTVELILGISLIGGVLLLLPTFFDKIPSRFQWIGWTLALLVAVFSVIGYLRGFHLRHLRGKIHHPIKRWVRRMLIGETGDAT